MYEIRKSNLTPALITYYKKPLLVHQGHMQWLWDHEGRRYLDMIGGIVTVSVGHAHPKVVQSLQEQSQLLWHTTSIYMHPKIHEYAEKLTSKLPGNLKVAYFVNSGSEANDLAMFMARLHTGRYDIISLENAYHGASPYTIGLTSLSTWKHNVAGGFGVHQTTNPDVYRGIWGGANCRDSPVQTQRECNCVAGECQASDRYLDRLHDVINFSIPKQGPAAFFAESIQGIGGTVQFPKNFLKKAFELVRSKGGLCVSDEVQTGFGRTGDHLWGFQGHDVIPDIVTMAKGIANGFPMAAVVTTPEVSTAFQHAYHFNTFGGNPLACAVASTVLDVIEEDHCQELSRTVGTYLLTKLAELRDEFECVGDIRGKGLMIGMELVKDKASRQPLDSGTVNNIWETTKDLGLLVGKGGLHSNVFRIKPPMCITTKDADFTVQVLRRAISDNVQ
jgi:alanine-glyoxylate transaminase/(R)-3-amino-2-methylpropionate-pyruvate transaminase